MKYNKFIELGSKPKIINVGRELRTILALHKRGLMTDEQAKRLFAYASATNGFTFNPDPALVERFKAASKAMIEKHRA